MVALVYGGARHCGTFLFGAVVNWTKTQIKQGVAPMGCNRTGPMCSVGRLLVCRPSTRPAAGRLAALETTTTDASQQNNTGPLGGPVIISY